MHEFRTHGRHQPVENILDGDESLYPGSSMSVYYVFDKIAEQTPRRLTVYIDGEEHYEGLEY